MLELVERLKNGDLILESKMAELNQNKKSTRLTRFCVKALFYLGNKFKNFVEAYHKKNFQVRDGERDSIFPDTFSLGNYK